MRHVIRIEIAVGDVHYDAELYQIFESEIAERVELHDLNFISINRDELFKMMNLVLDKIELTIKEKEKLGK